MLSHNSVSRIWHLFYHVTASGTRRTRFICCFHTKISSSSGIIDYLLTTLVPHNKVRSAPTLRNLTTSTQHLSTSLQKCSRQRRSPDM